MSRLIGLTGPSTFTNDCQNLIEKRLKANFVMLYHNEPKNILEWIPKLSGVILAGGVDIHPQVYGQSCHYNKCLSRFDWERDLREILIISECQKQNIPMFGICRGHQLLSIALGLGDRFIMDLNGDICHQPMRANINLAREEGTHSIHIDTEEMPVDMTGQKFYSEIKEDKVLVAWVNSFHHQGVAFRHKERQRYEKAGITVLATASTGLQNEGQIIEAMRGTKGFDKYNKWISCQWHPENDHDVNPVSAKIVSMYEELLQDR